MFQCLSSYCWMDAKFHFFFNLSFIAPRIDAGNKWNVYEAFIDCVFRESVLPLKQGHWSPAITRTWVSLSINGKFPTHIETSQLIWNKSIEWFLCNRNIGCYWNNFLQIFFQINVLQNFAIFTKKQLCRSLFFNKISKKRLQHRCFLWKSAKFRRTPFFTEHLR